MLDKLRAKLMVVKYFLLIVIITMTQTAYTYLDPGTGSLFIQSILAEIAGAIVVMNYFTFNLIHFVVQSVVF